MEDPLGYAAQWFGWKRKGPPSVSIGTVLAFKSTASHALADRPARVVAIGPRFRSGDYLVTLEYAQPLKYHNEIIRRIDAFRSELYQPAARDLTPFERSVPRSLLANAMAPNARA